MVACFPPQCPAVICRSRISRDLDLAEILVSVSMTKEERAFQ
jgi:hypothetical protein